MRVSRVETLAGSSFYTFYTFYTFYAFYAFYAFYTFYAFYAFSTRGRTSPLVAPDHGLCVAHGHQCEQQAATLARAIGRVTEVVGAGGVPGQGLG